MRAKFKVTNISESFAGEGDNRKKVSEEIRFNAVYSDDPNSENRKWALSTPAGNAYLKIDNHNCFGHYKEGQEVFFDIFDAHPDL